MHQFDILKAVDALQKGDVIAVPTETVYGLAVDSANPQVIEKLYTLKKRPYDKRLPIAISNIEMLASITDEVNQDIQKLIKAFWPGALTIVVQSRSSDQSIAVRCPQNQLLRDIIAQFGKPIALTSANISGEPDCLTAQQVRANFHDLLIVEDDSIIGGAPSTIIDMTQEPYRILRLGAISAVQIQDILSKHCILVSH